jgi:hypothetical protein
MPGILQTLFLGAAAAVKDAYFNLVTLLLNTTATNGAQNNTFLDSSTNNFTITRNGNTTQGTFTPFSQTGWGNYFGASSFIQSSVNSVMAFASNPYTIEFWIYLPALPATAGYVYSNTQTAGAPQTYISTTGQVICQYQGSAAFATTTSTLSAGTWNHVAIVRTSTSSNGGTIYFNGTNVLTYTDATNVSYTAASAIIGNGGTNNYLNNAYISNFRVCKGTAVYTGNFTPSTTSLTTTSQGAANCSLLTCQSNRFIDNSSNAATFTVTGTPSVQAFSPFAPTTAYDTAVVGGSGYFGAATDYLTWTGTAVGSGAFTVEFFFYNTADYSVNRSPIGVLNTSGYNSALDVRIANSTTINISQYNVANNNFTVPTMASNTWYHVAITRNSSNAMTVFLNGVRSSTGAVTIATNFSGLTSSIARIDQTNVGAWIGYLSNIRIVTGTNIYDPTQTTITIPTAPLTAVSGTQMLMSATNAGIYDSAAKNDLQTVGNAQVSTTQAKWGTTSMYFNGSTGYLKPYYPAPANGTNFTFGTGDFTIEFWMYPTSQPANGMIMDGRGSGASGDLWLINWVSGVANWYAGAVLISSSTISANTWTHLAICRSGTSTKMFLNGTQTGSTYTDTKNYTVGNGWPTIGASYNAVDFFAGYIDDLRITKGYARYTANFTPPTAAFLLQ